MSSEIKYEGYCEKCSTWWRATVPLDYCVVCDLEASEEKIKLMHKYLDTLYELNSIRDKLGLKEHTNE